MHSYAPLQAKTGKQEPKTTASGPLFFGLKDAAVARAMSNLPNANLCTSYVMEEEPGTACIAVVMYMCTGAPHFLVFARADRDYCSSRASYMVAAGPVAVPIKSARSTPVTAGLSGAKESEEYTQEYMQQKREQVNARRRVRDRMRRQEMKQQRHGGDTPSGENDSGGGSGKVATTARRGKRPLAADDDSPVPSKPKKRILLNLGESGPLFKPTHFDPNDGLPAALLPMALHKSGATTAHALVDGEGEGATRMERDMLAEQENLTDDDAPHDHGMG